jgi:hypothetical protein
MKRNKIHLYLDIALLSAFVLSLRPFFTGMAVHEWLGLALGGALLVHLWRHHKWVAAVTRQFVHKLPLRTRLYYVLDAALLVAFATIVVSGVAMSRVALPALGLEARFSDAWLQIHELSSWLGLAMLAAKLVLHRRWIARVFCQELGWCQERDDPRRDDPWNGNRPPVLQPVRVPVDER